MLLFICLIAIMSIIGLALIIQYLVKSKRSTINGGGSSVKFDINSNYVAMITSDWHIEPWYTIGGGGVNNWDTSKIDDWGVNTSIKCEGIGGDSGDTPLNLLHSALENYIKGVNKEQRLLFFTGDTFSHDLKDSQLTADVEYKVMSKTFNAKNGLLSYFNPENIFYTVGNHGGLTDQAFWQEDDVSEAWAQSLIDNNIIPTDQIEFFKDTGYYKKHIPNSTIYVICFNSMLYSGLSKHQGCTGNDCNLKQQRQIDQLKKDLDSLQPENTAYILSHYPIDSADTSKVSLTNFIWSKIGYNYQSRVSGIFTAHTHDPLTSLNNWKTTKGDNAYTWNIPSIYWSWNPANIYQNKKVSSYISITFPLNNPLVMAETDVYKTICQDNQNVNDIVWKN